MSGINKVISEGAKELQKIVKELKQKIGELESDLNLNELEIKSLESSNERLCRQNTLLERHKDSLEGEIEKFKGIFTSNVADEMKFDWIKENFSKVSLDDLEGLLK